MSTRSDPSKEGLNESHINDTERSKWFWWRWKRSNDIWFRVEVMKGWRIMYGSGWDTVDFSERLLLNIWRHLCDGSVALPQIWMVWRDHGDVTGEWNNPTRLWYGGKVSCSRANCYHQSFLEFLPIFPQSLLTSTSLFLSSLRRITYACSITCPSGKPIAMF